MNNVAILPKTIMYLLQNQNVKREVAKKAQVAQSVSSESVKVGETIDTSSSATPLTSSPAPPLTTEEVGSANGTNIADLNTSSA